MNRLYMVIGVALVLIGINAPLQAETNFIRGDKLSATATLKGNLIKAPDCHINDDKAIDVPFGNVGVNKVDGIHYSRNVDYTVACDGGSDEHLYLSLNGNSVTWDEAAVKTSVDNFAIEIRQNGKPFRLGSNLNIDLNALPSLTAVPVKYSGQTLLAGDFSAGATLIAFYQ